jgi:hypothetical protein
MDSRSIIVSYRVIEMTTHHKIGETKVETASEAIQLGEKIYSKGLGTVFISLENGEEKMSLQEFKAKQISQCGGLSGA